MSAHTKQQIPDTLAAGIRPIELQTDNGFSIIRRWEVEGAPAPVGGVYVFIVRVPEEKVDDVVVAVKDELMTDTQCRTRGRIRSDSPFWICCAERQLANFVAEKNDFPADKRLTIAELDAEGIMLALRWERS